MPSERNQFAVTYNGLGVAGLLRTVAPRRPAAHRDRGRGRRWRRRCDGSRVVDDALSWPATSERVIDATARLGPPRGQCQSVNVVELQRAYQTNHVAVKRCLVDPWPRGHVAMWP